MKIIHKIKYKIAIEYDGTNYCGWQKQKNQFSIQENIEKAIKSMTNEITEVYGCGRTDAGVHALNMIAHFTLNKSILPYKIIDGLNHYLRIQFKTRFNYFFQDISILNCEIVDNDFHARFSAKKRYYKYLILNRRSPTALYSNRVWQIHRELNINNMKKCLKFLIGKKDWSCFRDSECQALSPIKTIDNVELTKENDIITFYISAPSFLQHQVRNIVGTLVDVGLQKKTVNDFEKIIESKDRSKAGQTAPAQGLYFIKADY